MRNIAIAFFLSWASYFAVVVFFAFSALLEMLAFTAVLAAGTTVVAAVLEYRSSRQRRRGSP